MTDVGFTAMPTEQEEQALLLQLLDPANRADPYPLFAQIRATGPLLPPGGELVVFSSYRDCAEVLRNPSSSNDRAKSAMVQRQLRNLANDETPRPEGPPGFLFLDPPDHTRLRKLVSKAFAPKVVNALKPDIILLVDGLVDRIAQSGRFDVIDDFAYPLPVAVICRLLGVPLEDEQQFSHASGLLAQALDPFVAFTGDPAAGFEDRMAAARWLRDYFHGLIEQRRSHPGDDLLSGLIAVKESGDQLSEAEIIATCTLLLIAGHETTVNLIANAILALLRDPPQWAALSADAGRASAVLEETMRYDPPVQMIARIAADDMTISGIRVAKGNTMMLLLAAAQRDPAEFDRPDDFDPDRGLLRHLGFGHGAHYCIGAPLARLEASVALSTLAGRFPNAGLDSEPLYKKNVTLRGMSALQVAV